MPNNFNPHPHGIQSDYGFFHVYSFTMTMAILITALLCYIKFKRRNVPAQPILGSLIIVVPIALLGASFFGKLNGSDQGVPSDWWTLFYFWVGGLSIHGAILFGSLAGVLYFSIFSRRYNVSMWVYIDVILPNVLIGQVIGRWGNFFNHELLGNVVDKSSLDWLPAFIRDNCFKLVDGLPQQAMGHVVYREPIFLYESFGNFCAWALITFGVPHIGRWLGPKPQKQFANGNVYSWKYNFTHLFKKRSPNHLSYRQWWEEGFFAKQPTLSQTQNASSSKELEKLHNPEKYWITRSGVQGGMYFFLWNGIRLILETHRQDGGELFLPYHRALDYAMIGMFAAIGLVLVVITQFILPRYMRKTGWQYEKNYIDFTDLKNWRYDLYAKNHMRLGIDNTKSGFMDYFIKQTAWILGIKMNKTLFNQLFTMEKLSIADGSNNTSSLVIRFKLIPSAKAKKDWQITETCAVLIDFSLDTKTLKKPWSVFKKSFKTNYSDLSPSEMFKKFINSDIFKDYVKLYLQKNFKSTKNYDPVWLQTPADSIFDLQNLQNASIFSNNKGLIIENKTLRNGYYFASNRNVKLAC